MVVHETRPLFKEFNLFKKYLSGSKQCPHTYYCNTVFCTDLFPHPQNKQKRTIIWLLSNYRLKSHTELNEQYMTYYSFQCKICLAKTNSNGVQSLGEEGII